MRIDFELSGYGRLYLLRPITRTARLWVDERLPADAIWFGRAVVVERRYTGPIIGSAIADGLTVR